MQTQRTEQAEYHNSIVYNKDIASAFANMFEQQNFQFHLTANFNRTTTLNNGRDKLKVWSSRLDRKLFGSRYYKRGTGDRIFFVAIPEHGNASMNLHYHMLVRVPLNRHDEFKCIAESIWKEFNPTGSLFIQSIGDTSNDRRKVIGYDLKDAWKKDCNPNIIISSEFSCR